MGIWVEKRFEKEIKITFKKGPIIATALSVTLCLITQSAMATGSLDDKNMLFAFGTEGSVNTMVLSEREMEETRGKFWPWVTRFGWGAISGSVNYTVTNWGTDNWDLLGLGQSVFYGGIGGLFGRTPAMSATLGAGSSAALNRWGSWDNGW